MEVNQKFAESWKVTLVDTGLNTMTGGRLKKIQKYLDNETFCFTYGDGVSDVNITASIAYHKSQGRLATVTAVQPPGRYGALQLGKDNGVVGFQEKPHGEGGWINGGFFVLEPQAINVVECDDDTSWEQQPLIALAKAGQLAAYKHSGFWQPMDTIRDRNRLEELWASGHAHSPRN